MPGFPSAPSVQTVTDKLASLAAPDNPGNVAGYYVYLRDPLVPETIYESATTTDSGGNWSIAGVPAGTYQYAFGIHPNTRYRFQGTYLVALNPAYPVGPIAGSASTALFDWGGGTYNIRAAQNPGGIPDNTGALDTSASWQQVLAALPAKGSKIVVPSGDYKMTAAVAKTLVAGQHIEVEGDGQVNIISTVPEPGGEAGIFTFTGDAGGTCRLTFRNFKISHTNSGVGLLDGILIMPPGWPSSAAGPSVTSLTMEAITLTGLSRVGCRPIWTQNANILRCQMSGNRNAGLFLLGDINAVVVGGDYSNNVTGALNADYGIAFDSSSIVPYARRVLITGAQANNNGRKGFDVHHGHDIKFVGCNAIGNGYCGFYAVAEGSDKDTGDITIDDCTIDMAGGNATLQAKAIEIGTFGNPGALSPGSFIVSKTRILNVDALLGTSVGIYLQNPITGAPPEKIIISDVDFKKGSGATGQLILGAANAIPIPYVAISDVVGQTVACADIIKINAATQVRVHDNELQVDSGTPTTGISVPTTAIGSIEDNQLNGAVPTTPISAGNSVRQANNTQSGTPVGPGWNPGGIYGDGSDGALVFDGAATILGMVPSANVYLMTRDIMATNITVNAGITIRTLGNRIYYTGILVNRGFIRQLAGNASGATGGVALAQNATAASYSGSATCGAVGANGGTGNGGGGGAQAGISAGGSGGNGGTSGANTAGTGGAATGATAIPQLRAPYGAQSGRFLSAGSITGGGGGGAGAGDGVNAGGGGGGGGGAILICGAILDNAGGVISCIGGNGGTGVAGNAAGGGGGGGGYIVLVYSQLTALGTVDVSGGALGAHFGGGTGTDGVAGSAGTVVRIVN